jgi:glycosyltransferase involved in cell wall biosynthesis
MGRDGSIQALTRGRLLYVVNDTPYFVRHWLERAVAARDYGYETHVAGSDGEDVDRVLRTGLLFHPVPFVRGRAGALNEARTLATLSRVYRAVRPDVAHHITIKPVIYGGLVARRRHVPAMVFTIPGLGYVFSQQGLSASLQRAAVKRAYRTALAHPHSTVIFENPDDRRDFLAWRLVADAQAIVIKGAGVDLARFRPSPDAGTVNPPTIVLASRLLWDKGVGVFVEAAAMLKATHPRARMIVIGWNDVASPASIPAEQLQAWADSGAIEWWGLRDDMPQILAAATIVCLPSFYREGIPRVLIEAAACGRPIVTTDTAGCREIVRHGENGLLVPPRDPAALARAIGALLDDPALRDRMGAEGRRRAAAEYGTERVVAQTLAVYDHLTARKFPAA